MASQCLRQRGLATLAIVGLLTLIALGGALLALRLVLAEERLLRLEARRTETDTQFEAALLHLLEAPRGLDGTLWSRDGCHGIRHWPESEPFRVRIRLDRCRTGPDRIGVRLESLSFPNQAGQVRAQIVWQAQRWRILPGSWHDFTP